VARAWQQGEAQLDEISRAYGFSQDPGATAAGPSGVPGAGGPGAPFGSSVPSASARDDAYRRNYAKAQAEARKRSEELEKKLREQAVGKPSADPGDGLFEEFKANVIRSLNLTDAQRARLRELEDGRREGDSTD
jgi:hypothetical protein